MKWVQDLEGDYINLSLVQRIAIVFEEGQYVVFVDSVDGDRFYINEFEDELFAREFLSNLVGAIS